MADTLTGRVMYLRDMEGELIHWHRVTCVRLLEASERALCMTFLRKTTCARSARPGIGNSYIRD